MAPFQRSEQPMREMLGTNRGKAVFADHVGCRRTELGNAAVEAITEIVSDNEERPCRNDYRMKYRIIG